MNETHLPLSNLWTDRQEPDEPITETAEIFLFPVGSILSRLLNHERCCHVASQTIAEKTQTPPYQKHLRPPKPLRRVWMGEGGGGGVQMSVVS